MPCVSSCLNDLNLIFLPYVPFCEIPWALRWAMLEPKPWQKRPHLRTLEIFIGDFRLFSREMLRSKK
jgi:hypothetical protein